ncbi:MAG: hypothetical protein VXZ77_04115 [Pseudomonadota bacterium]|nr:hypothetical protein [Pseudomonadota bacterium]
MNETESFFFEGCAQEPLSERAGYALEKIFQRFDQFSKAKLIEKYRGVFDLPMDPTASIWKEVDELEDLLKLNDRVGVLTGRRVEREHAQLRAVLPSAGRYMSWHRDVHRYNPVFSGRPIELTGDIPVKTKVILYPKEASNRETLQLLPGSHLAHFSNKLIDMGINRLSKKKISLKPGNVVYFRSDIYHHTPAIKAKEGLARLIFIYS